MIPSCACPSLGGARKELFVRQVERLLEGGWHKALGWAERDLGLYLSMLADPPSGLLHEIGEMSGGQLPFLVVIPHALLSIEKQMGVLLVAKKRGYASLDSAKLWNPEGIGESKNPYLISDVDDGAETMGRNTGEVAGEIRRACRRGLVMEEAIALAVQSPESLVHHAFALIESHYQGSSSDASTGTNSSPQCVPELWLSSGGPTQSYSWLSSRREDRGVPSCRRRLFLGR